MTITPFPLSQAQQNHIVHMSPAQQQQLMQSLARMDHIGSVSVHGIDAVSNLYGYAEFRILSTLGGAALLAMAAQLNGTLTPEGVEQLRRMNAEYTNQIASMTSAGAQRLIEQVKTAASQPPSPPSFLSRLRGK